MKILTLRKGLIMTLSLGVLLAGVAVYAAVNVTIATGTIAHFEPFNGPATITMRTLTIAPGEVLGWHAHPGVGAYTIVKQGTLTVEDGCGGEEVFTQGQAFLEPPNHVHRGKNLTTQEVITAQTFVVPLGTPISISTDRVCGSPPRLDPCLLCH